MMLIRAVFASVAVVAAMPVGAGVACAAPAVVGKTYADAKSAIADSGGTAVVESRVGDRKAENDCVVTSVRDSDFLDASGKSQGKNVLVDLNCYATYASAVFPGYSLGSPEGRADYEAALAKKKAAQAKQAGGSGSNASG
jgi:hypothetical protein